MINGLIYVGSSRNLKSRRITHFSLLRNGAHANKRLQSDFTLYGEDNFTFDIIEYCPIALMASLESSCILQLQSSMPDKGYNKNISCNNSHSNSGRKPEPNKKQAITISILRTTISEHGGKEPMRDFLYSEIRKEYENILSRSKKVA